MHPLSHPNDYDIKLSKISNNMNILDCGSGMLGLEDRIIQNFKNINIHVVNKVNEKFKKKISDKINENGYKIKPHFVNFKNMNVRFDEIKFDRILFIESLSYSDNILEILTNCFNILKDDGILYIRAITPPKTNSKFINNNIHNIERKIDCNLIYHQNIIYFLQEAGFKNIKYSSVPIILSENYSNPFFIIPLLRYKLFNLKNMYTQFTFSETSYVVSK